MSGSNNNADKQLKERIEAQKKLEQPKGPEAPRMLAPSSNKNNYSVKQPQPPPPHQK